LYFLFSIVVFEAFYPL